VLVCVQKINLIGIKSISYVNNAHKINQLSIVKKIYVKAVLLKNHFGIHSHINAKHVKITLFTLNNQKNVFNAKISKYMTQKLCHALQNARNGKLLIQKQSYAFVKKI
jgi:serine kinase of HPr protein (carbohydrate metabolism regulator)